MAATRASSRAKAPRTPAGRPLHAHLSRNAGAGAVVVVPVTLIVAALATSRATAHVLTATALAVIVAGAAASGVLVGWANGLYNGAADILRGETVLDCAPGCDGEPSDDPWSPARLWRTTAAWAAMVALWAASGGALLAVALNGKRARLLVVFVALAGLGGLASIVVDAIARDRGAHATRVVLARRRPPTGVRRRGWLQVAVPIAVFQLVVNAGMAWVLFHDYSAGSAAVASGKVLTRSVALADVVVLVTLVSAIFGAVCGAWGATDLALGRVALDDPATQETSAKSPVGVQGIIYIALLGLLLGKVAGWVLPGHPSLIEVALARGCFAAVLAFLAAGAGYVRGAVNGASRIVRVELDAENPSPLLVEDLEVER